MERRNNLAVLQESDINVRPNYPTYISQVRLIMFSLQTLFDKNPKILVKLCLSFTGFFCVCVNLFFFFFAREDNIVSRKEVVGKHVGL